MASVNLIITASVILLHNSINADIYPNYKLYSFVYNPSYVKSTFSVNEDQITDCENVKDSPPCIESTSSSCLANGTVLCTVELASAIGCPSSRVGRCADIPSIGFYTPCISIVTRVTNQDASDNPEFCLVSFAEPDKKKNEEVEETSEKDEEPVTIIEELVVNREIDVGEKPVNELEEAFLSV